MRKGVRGRCASGGGGGCYYLKSSKYSRVRDVRKAHILFSVDLSLFPPPPPPPPKHIDTQTDKQIFNSTK